jgi:hypothetical protein
MARRLRDELQNLIGSSTGIFAWIGFGTLLAVSLSLPKDFLSFTSLSEFYEQFPNFREAVHEFSDKVPALLLALVTVTWYFQYKHATVTEVDLIDSMFSERAKPTYFGNLVGHHKITILGYSLVLTFAGLILSVTQIEIFCTIALVLHAIDLIGNGLVLQNISRAVARFKVAGAAEETSVSAHREVMLAYYFENPTIPRVCVTMAITGASLLVAVRTNGNSNYWLRYSPYAFMIANILWSEAVMTLWRYRRNRALDTIALQEEERARLL